MKTYKIKLVTEQILADLVTPVGIYMQVRSKFAKSLLLESSDYHGHENSYSFICVDPVATFLVDHWKLIEEYPDGTGYQSEITGINDFRNKFDSFIRSFQITEGNKSLVNGVFGYSAYDAVQYFETIKFRTPVKEEYKIPDLQYNFFRYIIAINHFKNDLTIVENLFEGERSNIQLIKDIIFNKDIKLLKKFHATNNENSNITDDEYMKMVTKGKEHCYRGDVFQIVLSRQFSQTYEGAC